MSTTTSELRTRADAAERARKAWAARVVGATWTQAAQVAGYADASTACRGVRSYFGTLPDQDRGLQRDLWRERMEHLWRQSVRDVQDQRPGAVRAAVGVAQRAAQMDGLDAPAEHVLYTPALAEIDAYVERLREMAGLPPAPVEADVLDA